MMCNGDYQSESFFWSVENWWLRSKAYLTNLVPHCRWRGGHAPKLLWIVPWRIKTISFNDGFLWISDKFMVNLLQNIVERVVIFWVWPLDSVRVTTSKWYAGQCSRVLLLAWIKLASRKVAWKLKTYHFRPGMILPFGAYPISPDYTYIMSSWYEFW